MGLRRVLFVPDTHRPYHDKRAWALLLKAAEAFKPDVIVVLGDFADFYAVSDHDKNPNRIRLLDLEIEDVNTGLDQLDELGASEKVFVKGNHENRLERYLIRRAPELFNMVKVEDLFQLKDRGWKCVEYRDHAKIGKISVTHDVGSAGPYADHRVVADFQGNVAIGHTHMIGYCVVGSARGDTHVGAMFGWLGDIKQVDYMHRIKAMRGWALGFGVGYMEENGNTHLRPCPIVNYSVVIDGKLFKA